MKSKTKKPLTQKEIDQLILKIRNASHIESYISVLTPYVLNNIKSGAYEELQSLKEGASNSEVILIEEIEFALSDFSRACERIDNAVEGLSKFKIWNYYNK